MCRFGNQDADAVVDGMATRVCRANLMWDVYDGETCATLNTQMLRILSSVSQVVVMGFLVTSLFSKDYN